LNSWLVPKSKIESRSGVRSAKKPAREARELAILPSEYAAIIDAIRDPNFRDLIEITWESGMPSQEIRKIEPPIL
jgi:hypothetical protein